MEVKESITSNRSEWQKRICGKSVLVCWGSITDPKILVVVVVVGKLAMLSFVFGFFYGILIIKKIIIHMYL